MLLLKVFSLVPVFADSLGAQVLALAMSHRQGCIYICFQLLSVRHCTASVCKTECCIAACISLGHTLLAMQHSTTRMEILDIAVHSQSQQLVWSGHALGK